MLCKQKEYLIFKIKIKDFEKKYWKYLKEKAHIKLENELS